MNWNGDTYLADIEARVPRALAAVGIECVNDIRGIIGTPGRTKGTKTLSRGPNKGKQKTVWGRYGSNPSKPGEPPHKQHGTLRESMAFQVDEARGVVRIGSSLSYCKFLELGTAKMPPRPHLRPTLANNKAKYARIFARNLGGGSEITATA